MKGRLGTLEYCPRLIDQQIGAVKCAAGAHCAVACADRTVTSMRTACCDLPEPHHILVWNSYVQPDITTYPEHVPRPFLTSVRLPSRTQWRLLVRRRFWDWDASWLALPGGADTCVTRTLKWWPASRTQEARGRQVRYTADPLRHQAFCSKWAQSTGLRSQVAFGSKVVAVLSKQLIYKLTNPSA
jgi:hypothetical protein